MAAEKKWSVTYTKHVKQKRKVYQDGVLELRPSTNKVILYDDCMKVLGSRFIKPEDVFAPGESLAFEAYLVDIGDAFAQAGSHKPVPEFSHCQKAAKINTASESFHTPKFDKTPKFGQRRAKGLNVSPSRNLIREYKKNESARYGSSPGYPETTKSSKEEWQVLYTTQITQKAKKYHDGFLQLHSCGSQSKQVLLYDDTRRFLESRFLKVDEIVKSGESIRFDGHLVDIGILQGDHKPLTEIKVEGNHFKMAGKTVRAGGLSQMGRKFPVGGCIKEVPLRHANANFKTSIHENNVSATEAVKKPVRAACDILSNLRKTKSEMDVATTDRLSTYGSHAPQSSSFFQKNECLQDAYEDRSRKIDLIEEKTMKTGSSAISQHEDLEPVLVEITKPNKTGFQPASSFFLGSGAPNNLRPAGDTGSAMNSIKYEDSQVSEPKSFDFPWLDFNEATAVLPDNTKENAPAAVSGSGTHKITVKVEPESAPQPCADISGSDRRCPEISSVGTHMGSAQVIFKQDTKTRKLDELPSFDLGIW